MANGSEDLILIQSMNKKLLIDTGSPISFGDIRYVKIGGNMHPLSSNHILDDIRKHLGQDISGIIGMDIFNQYNMVLFSDGTGSLRPEIIKSDISYGFFHCKCRHFTGLFEIAIASRNRRDFGYRCFKTIFDLPGI